MTEGRDIYLDDPLLRYWFILTFHDSEMMKQVQDSESIL
jgi:hypothetical protein